MNKLSLIFLASSFAFVSACGGNGGSNTVVGVDGPGDSKLYKSDISRDQNPAINTQEYESLSEGNQAFAWEFYALLDEGDNNIFFSPYSISSALAMTHLGAAGNTKTEIGDALNFIAPDEKLHAGMNKLLADLESRNLEKMESLQALTLNVNNTIWPSDMASPAQAYLDSLAINYGAGVYALDYFNKPEDSRQTINAAVEDWTQGLIKNLLPAGTITKDTALVLTNTLYLYAPWQTPFYKEATDQQDFFNLDGTVASVDMMYRGYTMENSRLDNAELIRLPYRDNKLELIVMMPDAGEFADFESSLNPATLKTLLENTQPSYIQLSMPKFTLEIASSLKQHLMTLGMQTAFTNAADLSPMGIGSVKVSDIVHKAKIELHEDGTEAAAATAVIVEATSAPIVDRQIKIDKPFIFAIHDKPTGALLFLGRVLKL